MVSEGVEETAEAIVAVSVIATETPAHTIPQFGVCTPVGRLSCLIPNKVVEQLFLTGSFSQSKSQVILSSVCRVTTYATHSLADSEEPAIPPISTIDSNPRVRYYRR